MSEINANVISRRMNNIHNISAKIDELKGEGHKMLLFELKNLRNLSSMQALGLLNGSDSGGGDMMQGMNRVNDIRRKNVDFEVQKCSLESQRNNALNSMKPIGQFVKIDDSVRNFNGKNVRFNYNVSLQDNVDPAFIRSGGINVEIKIRSKKDNRSVKTITITDAILGKNDFIWDGKDDQDNLVENGDYCIGDVFAFFQSGSKKIDLRADATISGRCVSEIYNEGSSHAIELDNGVVYHKDDIVSISESNEVSQNEIDGSDYVGKSVDLNLENVSLYNGKTDVYFFNQIDYADSDIKISLYKNDKFVKTINQSVFGGGTKKGYNVVRSVDFGNDIPNGDYKIKVQVAPSDKNDDGELEYQVLDGKLNGQLIKSFDIENNILITKDGDKFPAAYVYAISTNDVKSHKEEVQEKYFESKLVQYNSKNIKWNSEAEKYSFDLEFDIDKEIFYNAARKFGFVEIDINLNKVGKSNKAREEYKGLVDKHTIYLYDMLTNNMNDADKNKLKLFLTESLISSGEYVYVQGNEPSKLQLTSVLTTKLGQYIEIIGNRLANEGEQGEEDFGRIFDDLRIFDDADDEDDDNLEFIQRGQNRVDVEEVKAYLSRIYNEICQNNGKVPCKFNWDGKFYTEYKLSPDMAEKTAYSGDEFEISWKKVDYSKNNNHQYSILPGQAKYFEGESSVKSVSFDPRDPKSQLNDNAFITLENGQIISENSVLNR